MNKVIEIGRLTKKPTYSMSSTGTAIARYTLAVDTTKDKTDFIPCICFGQSADFADKYLDKGTKIAIEGRIQSGSYDGKDGNKVYTLDVVVERHYFCESKSNNGFSAINTPVATEDIPEELPFL